MTHAESRELLLDLAYGELPANVEAEVLAHVAECPECQEEKAQLAGVRRAFAPIRESEEPSAGFDEGILAAARAEAQLTHDGNIGEVIEVSGNVAPLGIEPGRIDAHAAVAAPAARRRPKWMTRVALGGSVAAAAALALVVGTSLSSKQQQQRTEVEKFEIHVAPQAAPRDQLREAKAEAPPAAAPEEERAVDSAPPPTAAVLAAPQQHALAAKKKERAIDVGSGGDVADSSELALRGALDKDARAAGGLQAMSASGSAGAGAASARVSLARNEPPAAPPAAERADAPVVGSPAKGIVAAQAQAPEPVAAQAPSTAASTQPAAAAAAESAAPSQPVAAGPAEANQPSDADRKVAAVSKTRSAMAPAVVAKAAAPKPDAAGPPELEQRAEAARHGGNYLLAAGLYREAAAGQIDSSAAAWDLAHAVECLSAAGSFEEARKVRDQLVKSYPSESTATAAARRALREDPATPVRF